MTLAFIETLISLGEKWGPVAYTKAVELWHSVSGGAQPSKADMLAISDAALEGSAMQDELDAKDRAYRKAGTGPYAGQGPQP